MPLPREQKPCSFYRTNSCTKGAACPYSHTEQPQSSSRIVCRHYSTGTCSFGERCRNIHPKPDEVTVAAVASSQSPCVFWAAGNCAKGSQCGFLHGALASDAKSWREQRPSHSALLNFGPMSATRATTLPTESSEKTSHQRLLHESPVRENLAASPNPTALSAIESKDTEAAKDILSSETTVERNFSRTRATFGAGAAVLEVQTAFESRRVTLSNLSHEVTQKEILDLAAVLGALKSVVVTPPAPGIAGKAELEYLDINSAKTAATALDGHRLHARSIAAQLNLKSVDIDTADLRSSTLKISWFAPSRLAYAHYDALYLASRKASVLNGKSFAGRKVSTCFQAPSAQQRSSFTVIVKGLPLKVRVGDLKDFCGADSVTVAEANYHGGEGTAQVRKLLEDCGPLESFDQSHPKTGDLKFKALVRFAKPEHAIAAEKKMHDQSHQFLGGAKTWVTLLHSIKYNLPLAQFKALKDEFRQMQHMDNQSAKIRIYDTNEAGKPVDPVCVRIYGDDAKALCRLKSCVEGIVSGEELKHEGVVVWDEFFHGEGCGAFLKDVQDNSGAFVRRDCRRKKLQVSGKAEQRHIALELLLKKSIELRAQRHRISLTKAELGRLLQGGFARLEGLLGEDKLTLDIRTRTLVVQGGEEDIEVAKLSLLAIDSNVAPPTGDSGDCPVCFCDVTNPVQLVCGHTYCFGCLRHYLISAESFPVKCLGEEGRCDEPVALDMISRILLPADETKLFDAAFVAYIHRHAAEYHYCPTPDCELIYRPGEAGMVIRCSACLARICAHCHVENHEGLTCEEHRDNISEAGQAFMKWKQENDISACPGCGASIEKNGGCNHITCLGCGTHMCWVCKKTFGKTEIYEHMRIAHGGIGV